MLSVGSSIGRIRITGVLGSGGMGEVYAGTDEALGRRVALKSIRSDRKLDPQSRARFLREARALSRLDHPNICRIYEYIEGQEDDLLVLELIEGRTLRRAIADGLTASEKLDIAEAIARALDAAHRAGIVHRDLKPDNVMLTADDEVKVLDFGLARRIDAPAAEVLVPPQPAVPPEMAADAGDAETTVLRDATLQPSAASGSDRWSDATSAALTAAGATAGTPMYMSPEQARGEEITPASDLYSLGLVLQVLYSGREPYDAALPAREVLERAARGESRPPDGAPRDIALLIARLEQLQPSARPTASEVLARLRSIREKPKRRVRRAGIAAAIVLAISGAVRYTVDLRRERSAAVEARVEAERRRGQAEELIGFMVGDLRRKLEPLGRLDVLDEVGTKSLEYFATLRPEELRGEELARNATALSQLGEVRMLQGKLPEAIEAFERSVVLARAATAADPANAGWRITLGASHFWLGDARRRSGDLAGARAHFLEYRKVAEALVAEAPANVEYVTELAYAESNVGIVLEAEGNLGEALENYRRAAATFEARARTDSDSATYQEDLASAINKIGLVLQKSGALREAKREFEREFTIRQALAARDPAHAGWQQYLATSHAFRAFVLEWLGEEREALGQLDAALRINRALVRHDPSNRDWERNLAVTHARRANLLRRSGRLAESDLAYREAVDTLRRLTAAEPDRKSWKLDLASAQTGVARLMLERGEPAAAVAAAAAVGALLEPLFDRDGSDVNVSRLLGDARLVEGNARARTGDTAAAARAWSSALEAVEKTEVTPADPRIVEIRAAALLQLDRRDEGKRARARLAAIGFVSPEVDSICRSRGC